MLGGRRILFVGYPLSPHLQRWISHVSPAWDLHLWYAKRGYIPNDAQWLHDVQRLLPGVTLHCSRVEGENAEAQDLARTIDDVRPDTVHSICIQEYAYVTLEARKRAAYFPSWIVSNGGNDLYLYGRAHDHERRIAAVLGACDLYLAECTRDVKLAFRMGLSGEVFPVIPAGGGYPLERLWKADVESPSRRRWVLLKGYQHELGRALVALKAFELCSDDLRDYKIGIYGIKNSNLSASVPIEAEKLRLKTDLDVQLLEEVSHHQQILRHGRARISVGLSLSDGISASLLEAMIMGSFPIQSDTACANEWIVDGETGMIVPPESPEAVAKALRKALREDRLVDEAAARNRRTAKERLDRKFISGQIQEIYEAALSKNGTVL
jgi:hypothetical protein